MNSDRISQNDFTDLRKFFLETSWSWISTGICIIFDLHMSQCLNNSMCTHINLVSVTSFLEKMSLVKIVSLSLSITSLSTCRYVDSACHPFLGHIPRTSS